MRKETFDALNGAIDKAAASRNFTLAAALQSDLDQLMRLAANEDADVEFLPANIAEDIDGQFGSMVETLDILTDEDTMAALAEADENLANYLAEDLDFDEEPRTVYIAFSNIDASNDHVTTVLAENEDLRERLGDYTVTDISAFGDLVVAEIVTMFEPFGTMPAMGRVRELDRDVEIAVSESLEDAVFSINSRIGGATEALYTVEVHFKRDAGVWTMGELARTWEQAETSLQVIGTLRANTSTIDDDDQTVAVVVADIVELGNFTEDQLSMIGAHPSKQRLEGIGMVTASVTISGGADDDFDFEIDD